jgi:hypothetical protein
MITSVISLLTGEDLVLRPLMADDDMALAVFLGSLSDQTRRFYAYPGYDLRVASEMCDAINRYDKLRMVATAGQRVIGLFEFSLSIPGSDRSRYSNYGVELDEQTDVRFEPVHRRRVSEPRRWKPVADISCRRECCEKERRYAAAHCSFDG